jgi:hypothetical protein
MLADNPTDDVQVRQQMTQRLVEALDSLTVSTVHRPASVRWLGTAALPASRSD